MKALDSVNNHLSASQQEVFREILLEMVTLAPTGQFEPCNIAQSDLDRICGEPGTVRDIIVKLRDQNLVFERKIDDQPLLSFTNWAVLTAWPQMVAWLDEVRLKQRFRLRLKEATNSWEKRHRNPDLLWRGVMLSEADWEFRSDESLSTPEREFLNAT